MFPLYGIIFRGPFAKTSFPGQSICTAQFSETLISVNTTNLHQLSIILQLHKYFITPATINYSIRRYQWKVIRTQSVTLILLSLSTHPLFHYRQNARAKSIRMFGMFAK